MRNIRGEERCIQGVGAYRFGGGNLRERDGFEYRDIVWRIMFELIFKKYKGGLIWLKVGNKWRLLWGISGDSIIHSHFYRLSFCSHRCDFWSTTSYHSGYFPVPLLPMYCAQWHCNLYFCEHDAFALPIIPPPLLHSLHATAL